MVTILPHLTVGPHTEAFQHLSGIDSFLCVAQEKDAPPSSGPSHKVPIIDMQPIPPQQLQEAVEWIRDTIKQHHIFVFCNAGVGRSPSVIVAYLCCFENFSFGEAVEFVAKKKPYMSILPELISSIEEVKKQLAEKEKK